VLARTPLQGREQAVEIGEQQVGSAHQLHVEAGVEDVGGGESRVHEARLGPYVLGQMREEGDDVVLDLALDLVDAGRVELGLGALVPDRFGRALGDQAELRHGGGRVRLDLEPDAKARLAGPDRSHLGPGVAGNHGRLLQVFGQREAVAERSGASTPSSSYSGETRGPRHLQPAKTARRTLSSPLNADVIVLGAGIVGTSTALHLQKRGRSVVLVDRRGAGEETSYGNTGIIQREGVVPYPFPRRSGSWSQYDA
jgi:hypothetical protein